jgi:hypothetical protein
LCLIGGFVIKKWTTTSETSGFRDMCTGEKTVEEDSKVLGITWNAQTDEFGFKTKLNFSEKKRKIRSSPNLKQEEIRSRTPKDLTKRMILSQVNGIYDPLGDGKLISRCTSPTDPSNSPFGRK